MEKKSILEIQSVYTANAFLIDGVPYVGAGSETTPAVYVHDLQAGTSCFVNGCPGGVMSLCIYSGGDSGYAEREALLAALKVMDPARWLVIRADYYNRGSDPPLPVFIVRLSSLILTLSPSS